MPRIMIVFTPRQINACGVLLAITAMLFAYYFLQRHLELDPCALCMVDRALVVGSGAFFLIALIHNPGISGQRLYAIGSGLFALGGVLVCWRHIYLQHLPKDLVPACAPGLEYMLETLPLAETFRLIFNSSGECADIQWSLMGLSIPVQTLIVFNMLLGLALYQLYRPRSTPESQKQ